uniref:USP domain-containing protein n=1 Tax=viral metagenome TaxID=1070528 RepID=A0A6C0DXW6_9ZZZZ
MGKFRLIVFPENYDTLTDQDNPDGLPNIISDNNRSGLKILTYILYYAYYNTFEDSLNKYYLSQIMDSSSEKSSPSFQTVLGKMLLYINDIEKYQGLTKDENDEDETLAIAATDTDNIAELTKKLGDEFVTDLFYELQTSKLIKANKNAKSDLINMRKMFKKNDLYDLKYYKDLHKYTQELLNENNKYLILMLHVINNKLDNNNYKHVYSLEYNHNYKLKGSNYDASTIRYEGAIVNSRPSRFIIEPIKSSRYAISATAVRRRDIANGEAGATSGIIDIANGEAGATSRRRGTKRAQPPHRDWRPQQQGPHADADAGARALGPDPARHAAYRATSRRRGIATGATGLVAGITKTQKIGGSLETPTCGFKNVGNSCYFVSMIQLLWHINPFRYFFINIRDYNIDRLNLLDITKLNSSQQDMQSLFYNNSNASIKAIRESNGGELGLKNFLKALQYLFNIMNENIKDITNNTVIDLDRLIVPGAGLGNSVYSYINYIVEPISRRDRDRDQLDSYEVMILIFERLLSFYDIGLLRLFKKFSLLTRTTLTCGTGDQYSFIPGTYGSKTSIIPDASEGFEPIIRLSISHNPDIHTITDALLGQSGIISTRSCPSSNPTAYQSTSYKPFKTSEYIILSLARSENDMLTMRSIEANPKIKIENIEYIFKGCIMYLGGGSVGHYEYYSCNDDGAPSYLVNDAVITIIDDSTRQTHVNYINGRGYLFLYKRNSEILDINELRISLPYLRCKVDYTKLPNNFPDPITKEGLTGLLKEALIYGTGFGSDFIEPRKLNMREYGIPNSIPDPLTFIDISTETRQFFRNKLIRKNVVRDTLIRFETASEDGYHLQAHINFKNWKLEFERTFKGFDSDDTKIEMIEADWGVVTLEMTQKYGEIFACLNMANSTHPGSSYLDGARAQEENMFRRTDCHYSITKNDLYKTRDGNYIYTKKMTNLIAGQPDKNKEFKRFVYLDTRYPRICIKSEELGNTDENEAKNISITGYDLLPSYEIFPFFELRAAAINYSRDENRGKTKDITELRLRIRAQINTLKEANQKYAVLSAFGAGAFENDCSNVAMIYYDELLKEKQFFKVIAFAIYYAGHGESNYQIFASVFARWPTPREIAVDNEKAVTKEVPISTNIPNIHTKSDSCGRPKLRHPMKDPIVERQAIMEETLSIMDTHRSAYYERAAENLQRYKALSRGLQILTSIEIKVYEQDSLDVTKLATEKYGEIFACLNFADSIKPGGGYRNGRDTQEEDIFLRTDCHFSLDHNDTNLLESYTTENHENDYRYSYKTIDLINGITGRVYLGAKPQICFRGSYDKRAGKNCPPYIESEIFPFYELRSAAYDFRNSDLPNDSIEAIAQTEIRIAAQLDTLIEHGIRHAVFGAFGCGVFENDPNIVANAYYKEIKKRKSKFDVIWFAMYRPNDTFHLFTSIFENFNKKQD